MSIPPEPLNPKDKIGRTKVPYSHVPATGLMHQALAHGDGTRKYGLYNWREIGVTASEYISAAMRHMEAWFNGQRLAPDSNIHHLGHAAACLNILMDCEAMGNLVDDRPPPVDMDAMHGAHLRVQDECSTVVTPAHQDEKWSIFSSPTGFGKYSDFRNRYTSITWYQKEIDRLANALLEIRDGHHSSTSAAMIATDALAQCFREASR